MAMIETNLVPQPKTDVRLRFEVVQEDVTEVQRLVEATGFFAPHEVDVAVELVVERLSNITGINETNSECRYRTLLNIIPVSTVVWFQTIIFGPTTTTNTSNLLVVLPDHLLTDLQLLKYDVSQKYEVHHDYIPLHLKR